MKKNYKVILFYVILIAVIAFSLFLLLRPSNTVQVTYSEILQYFKDDQVKEFTVDGGNILTVTLYDRNSDASINYEKTGKTVSYELRDLSLFLNDFEDYKTNKNLKKYQFDPLATVPWWVTYLLPSLGTILLIGLLIFFMNRMNGENKSIFSFGKSKARPAEADKNPVTFADVAGADEEKEELVELVEFLKDPQKFSRLGAKIPHGVLLVGPPGTGKTLLAKAVAGEAGVPFFSISGSDFVEMYVGVGASRVRDLFDNARKTPAAIIFIDEIDAVGRHRGAGLGGGHDEREQTLNQLLVEMDGFGSQEGIIVIAATNRPDILDPALLRPGRFDRRVTVNYPDIRGREEILKVHAKNKPMEPDVDFHKIAQTTVGFTGADLANLLNEASLHAAKLGKSLVGMEDIEQSFMKIVLGPQKKSKIRTKEDNRLTAYHEAGHAVASYYCKHTDPVKFVSIIPAGSAGGVTVSIPEQDQMCETRGQMLDRIILSLGGRVAEELILDDISTGASSDIQQATRVARDMVTRYGMSDKLGTVLYGSEHTDSEIFLGRDFSAGKTYSEKTAAEIDDEIRAIITNGYEICKKILSLHIDKLHKIAEYLLHAEFMDADQFEAAMENDLSIEEIDEIAEEKRRRSREENERKVREEEEERRRTEEELRRELEERRRMEEAPAGETFEDQPEPEDDAEDDGKKEETTADPADATEDEKENKKDEE